MNKRTTITLMTHLRWGAFFLVLLFLVIQVMPRALGQRGQQDISKRTSDIQAPSDPASGTWTATGSLNTGRFLHTATLLPNGMVLVAGGLDSNFHSSASAELYDPASGTWTATGSLNTARAEHTATLLSNGMVLVAAGSDSSFQPFRERGTVRPGEWDLYSHGQPQHRAQCAQRDLAGQRNGPGYSWI